MNIKARQRKKQHGVENAKIDNNKHCEILVSCSDKGRNCIQAHETTCKLMKLHASSGNCMQAYVTACKLL